MNSKTLNCSFCNKTQYEVKKLIAGSKVAICNECTGMLINYSSQNNTIPMCPDPECKHHFLRDMFKGRITKKQLAMYDECCLVHMMTDKEDEAKVRITHGGMIKRIRKERLTSLQNNATLTQKWPMLNLIRQILKVNGYIMDPIRKSDGYDKTGKKLYKRYFLIKKQL